MDPWNVERRDEAMKSLLTLQQRLVPDVIETMKGRFRILRQMYDMQPVGRRTLAQVMDTTERILRGEVDFLKDQGLVAVDSSGMRLTPLGESLLDALGEVMGILDGRADLERELRRVLGLRAVRVVSGDVDENPEVKGDLGFTAARFLREVLRRGDVVAVTGGTTVAAVAARMPPVHPGNILVVPARGGVGERVEYQANTIAADLAERLRAEYLLFHVPDRLSEEAYRSLAGEPQIAEKLHLIRQASIVVHGIGQAIAMARRRRLPPEEIAVLEERGAVGEAFGYYFDQDGRIVYQQHTLGLGLGDISGMRAVIAVAGGRGKAGAIAAVAKAVAPHMLVTDEGAAWEILARYKGCGDQGEGAKTAEIHEIS
ncbi:sugar-binding transcriptional regulator [Kyrpidia spormannii]|uniref:Transcriptional regulator of gapA (CggR-fructose-1,6-bisphosphate) n=1 Tax=Kyrpidia spormannii TaxID=2055160 RepID=A0A6F9E343_9BACL|nr:sugar-binding domain-containing protein [Kyrpidia spormannii]CAB3390826.1 transcriptional regulator of gapA (CggR-fructose-1,6-bisphosphate) [Kyrpidia spormannii]